MLFRWTRREKTEETEVHYAAKPALLTLRSGEHVSFKDFVESRCKSLYRPFRPDRWLLNGHLQTLYCVFGNFEKVNQVDYRRTFIRTREGGTIGLDWVHRPHTDSLPDDTPIVVVKHGLTGGSYEAYVRCILDPATRSRAEGGLGYRAVVCNFRGCAGVPITSSRLYSGEATDDLRYETMYIKYRYPNAPVLGLGFSLGGNVLTKYLGEEGSRSRIDAGCVLGCPWDFVANNITLNSTPLGTYGYSMGMGKNLQNIVGLHADSLTQIPPVAQGVADAGASTDPANNLSFPLERAHAVAAATRSALALRRTMFGMDLGPKLVEFDQTFTRICSGGAPGAPFQLGCPHGGTWDSNPKTDCLISYEEGARGGYHENAVAYYRNASSFRAVKDIRVPFLAINAADDPVVTDTPLHTRDHTSPRLNDAKKGSEGHTASGTATHTDEDTRAAAENGWAALALTPHGGHLGWFEQRDGRHSGLRASGAEGPLDSEDAIRQENARQPQRWVQRPLLEWLCAMGDEFVRKPSGAVTPPNIDAASAVKAAGVQDSGPRRLYVDDAGWICEADGRIDIAVREISAADLRAELDERGLYPEVRFGEFGNEVGDIGGKAKTKGVFQGL